MKIHFYLLNASRYWTQTDREVIFPMIDCCPINQDIERVEKYFKVVTHSTICTGKTLHNIHEVIHSESDGDKAKNSKIAKSGY